MNDARWLAEAWREFGQAEYAGRRENPRIIALFREVGHAQIESDEVAWCAAFCGACLERSGVRSTRSLLARSYLDWGQQLEKPRAGAIAVFRRGNDPSKGHVGFWLAETDEDVLLLGGNQSNAVSVVRYPKSRLLSLRWPSDAGSEPAKTATAPEVPSATSGFDRSLEHVLEMEGRFTDDPHDPGGPTNFGITLAVFAAWRKEKLTSVKRADLVRDLKAISSETVSAIYRRRYWDLADCADLPAPLAFMHFDAAVNHGVGAATRCLQEAVGVGVDGEIGPETRAAIAAAPVIETLEIYAAIRRRRYRALPHFWRFGRGWLRRVDTTLARARQITTDEANRKPTGEPAMSTKSTDVTGTKWWGHSITIWGTIVTILSTTLPALAPVTGVDVSGQLVQDAGRHVVEAIQAVGTLVGTLMTIYGRFRATSPITLTLKRDG